MRRCPRSTKTTKPTTRTIVAIRNRAPIRVIWSVRTSSPSCPMAAGMETTMDEKITREMPLPMPRSVICSPSHMMKAVPEVSVIMHISRKLQPGFITAPSPNCPFSRAKASRRLWKRASPTVA